MEKLHDALANVPKKCGFRGAFRKKLHASVPKPNGATASCSLASLAPRLNRLSRQIAAFVARQPSQQSVDCRPTSVKVILKNYSRFKTDRKVACLGTQIERKCTIFSAHDGFRCIVGHPIAAPLCIAPLPQAPSSTLATAHGYRIHSAIPRRAGKPLKKPLFLTGTGLKRLRENRACQNCSPEGTAESAESSPGRQSWGYVPATRRSPLRTAESNPGRESWVR